MTDLFEKMKEIDEQEQQAQGQPFDMNNINPLQQYLLPQENPWKPSGTLGRTFALVDILSRPDYAGYGAAKSAIEGEGFGPGAYRGWTGEEQSQSWNVLDAAYGKNQWDPAYRTLRAVGIPEDSMIMNAETGLRNLYMTLAQPSVLMLAGPLGRAAGLGVKALKATKIGSKAAERAAPEIERIAEMFRPLRKHFLHPSEMEGGETATKHIMDMKEAQKANLDRYEALLQKVPIEKMTPQELDNIHNVIETAKDFSDVGRVVPREGVQILGDMKDQSRALQEKIIALQVNAGVPEQHLAKMIDQSERRYWPRYLTPGGERQTYKAYRRAGQGGLVDEPGRKIFKFVDKDGKIIDITDPTHPDSFIQKMPGKERYKALDQAKTEVFKHEASKKEIKDWITAKGGLAPDYDPNFARSMTQHIQNQLAQYHTLTMLNDFLDAGDVVKLARNPRTGQLLVPEGMRQLTGRGMNEFAARNAIADLWDRTASVYRDPNSFISMAERVLKHTLGGRLVKRGTVVFARNVLALHPQYLTRNLLSNLQLGWLAGVKNPMRYVDAIDLQYGFRTGQWGKSLDYLPPGLTNEQLMTKLHGRGLLGRGTFSESFMAEPINQEWQVLEALKGRGGITGKVAGTVQKPVNLGHRAVDWGFRVNSAVEDNFKLGMALDYLKKNKKSGRSTEQLIDDAIRHAFNFGFDYTDASRVERLLKVAFPFYLWTRNMTGRFLKDIVRQPSRVAALGRSFDVVGRDLLGGEILPDWEREIAPRLTRLSGGVRLGPNSVPGKISAMLGRPWDQSYRVNLGSYSPLSTIEDFYQSTRPPSGARGMGIPLSMAEGLGRWALSQGNPLGAGAYAFQSGQDPARERPTDWASTTPRDAAAGGLKSGQDYFFGYPINPTAKRLAYTIGAPASRYLGEAEKLLPALTGIGQNPEYDKMSPVEAVAGYLSGFRLEKDDPAGRARSQAFQYRQALSAAQKSRKNIIAKGNPVPESLDKKIKELQEAVKYWSKLGNKRRGPQSKAEFQRLLDKYK